jgi:hypothetical protein
MTALGRASRAPKREAVIRRQIDSNALRINFSPVARRFTDLPTAKYYVRKKLSLIEDQCHRDRKQ